MQSDPTKLPSQLDTPLLQRALDSSPIPFAVADASGRLEAFNRALPLWSIYPPQSLLGRQLVEFIASTDRDRVEQFLHACRATAGFELIHNVAFHKGDDHDARILLFGTPIRDAEGGLDGLTLQLLDVEEPARAFDRLESADEFHHLMVDASPDLMFVKDEQFRIVRANAAFFALYPDRTPDEILGSTTIEDYRPEDAEVFLEQDRIAFERGRSRADELILLPDGRERLLRSTKTRFEDGAGNRFILCMSHDVTERESLIEELRQSNADLDQFAYVASHDLRSPLQAIAKIANWIEEDCGEILPKESQEHFELLKSRVARLDRLLEDILTYSRVGRHGDQPEKLDLREVVADTCRLLELPPAFRVDVQPADLHLPRAALQVILRNTISNSVKHHHDDCGVIRIEASSAKRRNRLTITDDGPGIPIEYHDKAMNMFETLQPRDEVEGSGMGLALARRAATSFGGTLNIDPHSEAGTRIVLEWGQP